MDQPTTYPREHKSPSTRDTPLLCRFQDILSLSFFFFNDPPPTEISPLPLHDALPILANAPHRPLPHPLPARVSRCGPVGGPRGGAVVRAARGGAAPAARPRGFDAGRRHRCGRSEEHTSELQSRLHLVCRLPLEQKRTAQLDGVSPRGFTPAASAAYDALIDHDQGLPRSFRAEARARLASATR